MTGASYNSFTSPQPGALSDKSGATAHWARTQTWENEDSNHKYTPAPVYWRIIAFLDSCILLGGFLAIQPLYQKDPDLAVSKTVLTVIAIAALTLGWCLMPLLCFAVHSAAFRNEAIFIPGLGSSVVGLAYLSLAFVFSNEYEWTLAAWLGVTGAAVSSIVYLSLVVVTQIKVVQQCRHAKSSDNECEELLSGAAPMRYASPSPSFSSLQHHALQPPNSGRSFDTTQIQDTWGSAIDYYTTRRPNVPPPGHTLQSPTASPLRSPFRISKPLPSSPHDSMLNPSLYRRSSLSQISGAALPQTLSQCSGAALPYTTGEAPVMTLRAPSPPPEEERLRQQMLRLLVNQTSEQAMRNPDNQTFQIEVPSDMREVLLRASTDNESIRRAVRAQVDHRGRMLQRASEIAQKAKSTFSGTTESTVRDTIRESTIPEVPKVPEDQLLGVNNVVSPGGASVQETPATAYPPGQWKSREERRREIEMVPGRTS
ncbi:MAG: hypothetical protein Q9159_005125 [Coniocarpon cinnabarinum]